MLQKWFQSHKDEIKADYFSFLRFQSISADPAYAGEMRSCAEWLKNYIMKHCGMSAELLQTPSYPIVYAENKHAGEKAPTLLAYGHYDVQPVDPIELWKSDPFEPIERDGKIYARGAVDDKGQIFYALIAARYWKEMGKEIPVNLKFCIEGEEESGSQGLSHTLSSLKEKLSCDYLLVVDCGQFDATTPALTLGGRGIIVLEILLKGSNTDLHSGLHGGLAYNPNRALVEMLSKIWDEEGRIQIPGFYDDVLILDEKEKNQFSSSFDEKSYKREFGIDVIGGEKGLSFVEKVGMRPTFEINGMTGGYTGKGFKTVIPSVASAKISCRLVSNQDPKKIMRSSVEFLKRHAPHGMHVEIKELGSDECFFGKGDSLLAKAISVASTEAMQKECKKVLSGGSIPIIAKMVKTLGADVVGMGQCLPTDDIHAPNEHFDFQRFEYGFITFARALELL